MPNWIDTLNARARGDVEGFTGNPGDANQPTTTAGSGTGTLTEQGAPPVPSSAPAKRTPAKKAAAKKAPAKRSSAKKAPAKKAAAKKRS